MSARPSLPALYRAFLAVGTFSVGGGLAAWIRREIATKRGWIDDSQFLTAYALCQLVPGATNVNLAVFLGTELRGGPGALAALAGLMTVPVGLFLALGTRYFALDGSPAGRIMAIALAGMGASAVGMMISIGLRLGRRNVRHLTGIAVAALTAFLVGWERINLILALALLIPFSLALHWRAK